MTYTANYVSAPPSFKPSEVRILRFPFVGTFNRAERETAAAVLVVACQKIDAWAAFTLPELADVLEELPKDHVLIDALNNPFTTPDFEDLVAAGFAEKTETGAYGFTQQGFERLARWAP